MPLYNALGSFPLLQSQVSGTDPGLVVRPVAQSVSSSILPVAVKTGSVPSVIAPANAARIHAMFYNESSKGTLYLQLGQAASANYSVPVTPGQLYELPVPTYAGDVYGYWDSKAKATERALVTEFT